MSIEDAIAGIEELKKQQKALEKQLKKKK